MYIGEAVRVLKADKSIKRQMWSDYYIIEPDYQDDYESMFSMEYVLADDWIVALETQKL